MKGYIGDAVMAEPSLRALTASGLHVSVSTSPAVRELFGQELSDVRFLDAPIKRDLRTTLREAQRLRRMKFDASVLVNNSFRSALIVRLAGIPVRIGFARENRDSLLTRRIVYDDHEFQANSVARLVAPLGIDIKHPRPKLNASREEALQGKTRATIGFQPGARDPWKRLPTSLSIDIARMLAERGHRLAILGGSEERDAAGPVLEALGNSAEDHVGSMSLRCLLGCMSGLAACMGADTGVMHLAVASGCPTLQIFNSERGGKWGHDYSPHRVVFAPGGDMSRLDPREIADQICGIALATSTR
jgi:heptosyltransferase-2